MILVDWSFHLNTVADDRGGEKQKQTGTMVRDLVSPERRSVLNETPTELAEEEEIPYSPPALEWDEQDPDDVQQEPPVDAMYCGFCLITPCLFIQWQEDILRSEAYRDPGETNRAKRFIFYLMISRELFGHLGKGVRKPLPRCFVQGARELYPTSEAEGVYTGFKRGPGGDGGGSSIS